MTTSANRPLFEGILARSSASARHLEQPVPDEGALEQILFAASRAPDHGRLVPFRFVRIADDQRPRLGAVLAQAAQQTDPAIAEAELARIRDKALEGPCAIALVARIDDRHPKIPASDQWLSVGCALENLLLAAAALGFAAAVKSGRHFVAPAVREAFRLEPSEQLVAYVLIGTPTEAAPAKPKPAVSDIVSHWT